MLLPLGLFQRRGDCDCALDFHELSLPRFLCVHQLPFNHELRGDPPSATNSNEFRARFHNPAVGILDRSQRGDHSGRGTGAGAGLRHSGQPITPLVYVGWCRRDSVRDEKLSAMGQSGLARILMDFVQNFKPFPLLPQVVFGVSGVRDYPTVASHGPLAENHRTIR